MPWTFAPGAPLAVQVADRLRADILLGLYQMGEQFPTVRALAEAASVNPNTIQRALLLLENEGLLVTKTTVGRFVTEDEEVIKGARENERAKFVAQIVAQAKQKHIECDQLIDCIQKGWNG